MCEPATIIAGLTAVGSALTSSAGVAALSIGSAALTGVGMVNQYNDGKANAQTARNSARAAYESDTAALTNRQLQEQQAAAQQTVSQQREFRSAKATAIVGAEDAGIMGLSVDALLNDLTGQQGARSKATNTNLQLALAQLQDQKTGADVQRQSRNNAARDPSRNALMIGLAGTALEGASGYYKATN